MTQAELLAENTGNEPIKPEEPKIIRNPVEGTDYTHIQVNKKHFLTLGQWRVTDEFDTEEELRDYMETHWMQLMTRSMAVIYNIHESFKQEGINGKTVVE